MNIKQTLLASAVGAIAFMASTATADTLRMGVEGAYAPKSTQFDRQKVEKFIQSHA